MVPPGAIRLAPNAKCHQFQNLMEVEVRIRTMPKVMHSAQTFRLEHVVWHSIVAYAPRTDHCAINAIGAWVSHTEAMLVEAIVLQSPSSINAKVALSKIRPRVSTSIISNYL